jgi:hypothetical protein
VASILQNLRNPRPVRSNERGSFAGSSVTRGKSTPFYDRQGRFSGSAIRHGNWTSFYDGRGRFTGSVIDTGPRR